MGSGSPVLTAVVLALAGVGLLVAGAELLIQGSSRLALRWGVPPLVVGLTVVAYGTSTPELIVSAKAALAQQSGLALGNVVGSNIFNVLFILGASAVVRPLLVTRAIVWREVPVMIVTSVLVWVMASDGRVSRGEGVWLILLIVVYTVYQIMAALKEGRGAASSSPLRRSVVADVAFVFLGLGVLVWGARWLLDGSVSLARGWGVSELIIGLTIVAAGTSLPEVATSLLATWRGQREIAIGNVVGSNIYNALGVLGVAAAVAPQGVPVSVPALHFDVPVMTAVSVACLPIFITGHSIARWEGFLFLFYYGAYTLYLVLDAARHEALVTYGVVLSWVVVPLTVITLGIGLVRHWKNPPPS